MHWHRSHFHDVSQRTLCILLQSVPNAVSLTNLARLLHKSADVTRLAVRPWEQQGVVRSDLDADKGEPHYSLALRHLAEVKRYVRGALVEHAGLGELYFAYGSNLNPARLEARGITPRFIARSHAQGFTIGFPRRMRDGGGVAGMLAAPGGTVEGVIYLFSDEDFALLDRYEEAPRAYFRTPLLVSVAPSPAERPLVPRLCVTTYEAVPTIPAAPMEEYLGHMITGARFWGLSSDTVSFLESISPAFTQRAAQHGGRRSSPTQSKRVDRKRRRKRKT